MPVKTGKMPDMDTELLLVGGCKIIADGDALMVSGSYVLNVTHTAAKVLAKKIIFTGLVTDRDAMDVVIANAIIDVHTAIPPAKTTADDVAAAVKAFYRGNTPAFIRAKQELFGAEFEASKELTEITIVIDVAN